MVYVYLLFILLENIYYQLIIERIQAVEKCFSINCHWCVTPKTEASLVKKQKTKTCY